MTDDNGDLPEDITPEDETPNFAYGEEGDVDPETFPDPINLGTIEIAPGVFATITVDPGTVFDPAEVNYAGLKDFLDDPFGGVTSEIHYEPIPPDFDPYDPDVREFATREALERFLDESGLADSGEAYYDDETDTWYFWITGTE